jgi:hypothetical protein
MTLVQHVTTPPRNTVRSNGSPTFPCDYHYPKTRRSQMLTSHKITLQTKGNAQQRPRPVPVCSVPWYTLCARYLIGKGKLQWARDIMSTTKPIAVYWDADRSSPPMHLQRSTAHVHCFGGNYTALHRPRVPAASMFPCSILMVQQDARPIAKLVCSPIESNGRHSICSCHSSCDLHNTGRFNDGSTMVQSDLFEIS